MTVMIAGIPATVDAAPTADAAPKATASARSGDPDRQVPFGPALEDAKAAAGVHEAPEDGEAEPDDEANLDATPEQTTALRTVHLTTATDAPVAVRDHPTAKGASGEGGPSIGHTVEAAATPTPGAMTKADEGSEIGDGPAVSEGLESAVIPTTDEAAAVDHSDAEVARVPADSTSGDVTESVRAGGLASGVIDVDGPTGTVASEAPASGDEGPAPTPVASGSTTVSSTTAERAPEAAAVDVAVAAGDAANHASTSRSATDAADVVDLGDLPAAPAGEATANRVEDSASPAAAESSDETAPTPAARPSGAGVESAIAASRQEARTVGVASTASQISTPDLAPTPGPLAAAEGSLWDDVRLAFDRIRSTADGQEVRIRLRPAELGDLVVQVRTSGDQVSVRLTASSAAAHQTLVDDRLRLASELARAGFDEGSVDIGLHDGAGSFGDARHGRSAQDADEHRRSGNLTDPIVASSRPVFEERDPIRTHAVFRPGRQAYSTINLTL